MSASVADQDWLTAPATRAVLDALEAAGGPDCVRFVGGCVRNALMGQTVDDLDLATRLLPEATMAALQKAGLKVVPTGIAHGTVTAVSKGRPYEITTLRRDVSTDGRNATVAFTDDWAEDAARRDFRLNALYADAQGRVFDPTGQGVEDAREGRIVFVGEPETRIREDYLRILRFFRFFAWYGRGEPDTAGLAACADLSEGMVRLSAERVSKELLKLLAAPDPRPAVRAMSETGVLARLLPEADQPAAFEVMVGLTGDPVLRLSALLSSDQPKVEAAAKRLRLPNAMRDRLLAAAGRGRSGHGRPHGPGPDLSPGQADLRRPGAEGRSDVESPRRERGPARTRRPLAGAALAGRRASGRGGGSGGRAADGSGVGRLRGRLDRRRLPDRRPRRSAQDVGRGSARVRCVTTGR